jgi:hypothetical protein
MSRPGRRQADRKNYTSLRQNPHVITPNETIRIPGKPVRRLWAASPSLRSAEVHLSGYLRAPPQNGIRNAILTGLLLKRPREK